MGLVNFMQDAGEKLFGKKGKEAPAAAEVKVQEDQGKVLEGIVKGVGFDVDNLDIRVANSVATVSGMAASQETLEKVVLLVGNTNGISQVDNRMTVEKKEPEAAMYTVKSGDTLGKIAKEHYGSAGKYMKIFEANQPMLKDPDKIYPGQALRIPPLK
ncbi:MAG: peptidoglycan-binding protein LysM [Gemmatimonadota bacterium]|nr:MAG: peptidoglycan-binding protein LysM [Gemmatimonadota bacterium]